MDGASTLAMRTHGSGQKQAAALHNDARCLSLILPAWNEEAIILQAVQEAHTALVCCADTYEIIVIDDGSTDRTAEIVRDAAAKHAAVRLIQQPENRGYGAALRVGFESARYELVAFTDADCQFDLSDLQYMLPLADRYDIVSGYRIARKDPALRRFYSWGYNTLIQVLLGSSIRDMDCALKLFHREQLSNILPEASNYFANTEMLSEARARGMSIVDVGVQHRPRAAGESKVSIWDVPKTLRILLPYWWTRGLFAGRDALSAKSKEHFWPALLFLMLVSCVMLFSSLSFPLIEPDEGRYAEIPREMVSSGDWLVPQFLYEPYLDKPPMFYWLCAGSYSVFGASAWSARLVPATAAFLTILCTFLFGRRVLGTRPAFLGSMGLALCLEFVYSGRFLVLDSLLTFFVTGSLMMAYEAIRHDRFRWPWWLGSALFCGLGVLTKGPVAGVLLGPPVLAHLWLSRSRVQPSFRNWAAYGSVVLAVVLPWFAAIIARNPDFAYHFFWEHNVARFLNSVNHPQPIWYYIPAVIVGWMPWGLLMFPLCAFLFSRSQALRSLRSMHLGYFVLWSGWCLLFFSLSKGKLPTYVLPAFPAIALLLGSLLDHVIRAPATERSCQDLTQFLLRYGTYTLCIVGLMVGIAAYLLELETRNVSVIYCGLWVSTLIGLICFRRQLFPKRTVGVFASISFAIVFYSAHGILPAWGQRFAALPTASSSVREQLQDRSIPVACFGQDWGSVPFYLGRDDLHHFDSQSIHKLTDLVRQNKRAFLVLDRSILPSEMRRILPVGTTIATCSATPKSTVLFLESFENHIPSVEGSPPRISQRDENTTQ